MYSDFYKIPLPALRFEKVEETDTKVNDTEENDAFQIDHVREHKKTSEMTRKGTQTLPNNANTHLQTTLTRSEQRI